jgi:hypothetical protein
VVGAGKFLLCRQTKEVWAVFDAHLVLCFCSRSNIFEKLKLVPLDCEESVSRIVLAVELG